jgi:hypothetical protein
MVGMIVSLCLASKMYSEREFFVPTGTHLGVKLLTTMGSGGNKKLPCRRIFTVGIVQKVQST